MPRKKLLLQNLFPYGVTARSNNRDWFDIPMQDCWRIFEDEIAQTAQRYNIKTHAFVLMSNHFHWLVTTPDENLSEAMRYFMTQTSRRLARASGRINRIYGARYKWTLIASPGYFANTVRYFYQNPLRAGICMSVDEYPWSTHHLNSKIKITPCLQLEKMIPTDAAAFRTWLNKVPDGPYLEAMKLALRKPEFRFSPHPTTKRALAENAFL